MPLLSRSAVSGQYASTSPKSGHATTKLHTVMLEARRIRMAHTAGELTAEEAAEKLAELYNGRRFKPHRRGNSLLSA
jgi:hypothetical protein